MAISGILNIDKPAGMTSRQAVNHVQRLARPAKVGHAGTLDPLATGVLLVCVGRATRLIPYLQQAAKIYRATFRLGVRSETDDTEAALESVPGPEPSAEQLRAALGSFLGAQQQVPPRYSAVRVQGQRAYRLARNQRAFSLEAKPIVVHRLELLRYHYPEVQLDIECGSGTYIRSLGRDLAESLGTVAVMTDLVRTASGPFRLDDALTLDEITRPSLESQLQPLSAGLRDWQQVVLAPDHVQQVLNGLPVSLPEAPQAAQLAACNEQGELVAILVPNREQQDWKPARCFFASAAAQAGGREEQNE